MNRSFSCIGADDVNQGSNYGIWEQYLENFQNIMRQDLNLFAFSFRVHTPFIKQ